MQTVGSISKTVEGVSAKEVFAVWTDVNNWHKFDSSIKYARLKNDFVVGNDIILKFLNGREVAIQLTEITTNKSFTNVSRFPLAKMYVAHEIIDENDKLTLKVTIKIGGVLSFFWKRLVAQKVSDSMEENLIGLIELVKNGKTE